MSAVTMKVSGQAKVNKKLDSILSEKQRALVNAVEITQASIVNDAKSIVPVKTGFLRNSINPGKVNVDARSGIVDGTITADAEYASHVEFGTMRQKAQPYMIPAVMKNKSLFARLLKGAMKS